VVADAPVRDSEAIRALGFGVFSTGRCPADSLGRAEIVGIGTPVECGGIAVASGDLVLADDDGVAVVPARLAEAVLAAAERKASDESRVRDALNAGLSARDAFARYGVL
jgi:regulator of RNase E activity RraA